MRLPLMIPDTSAFKACLKFAAFGFLLLVLALAINYLGWYFFESPTLVVLSLGLAVTGFLIGFFSIAAGQFLTLRNWLQARKR